MHSFSLQICKGSFKALLWLKNISVQFYTTGFCYLNSQLPRSTQFLNPGWACEQLSPERAEGALHISSKHFALFRVGLLYLKQFWKKLEVRETSVIDRIELWASSRHLITGIPLAALVNLKEVSLQDSPIWWKTFILRSIRNYVR